MENGITVRLAAALLLVLLTVFRAEAADMCTEVKDTASNARNALLAYHDENMKYPDQLSSTAFNPPENIVVIYENMNLSSSKEMFMVRAYNENCGSMYLAVPATPEIFEIPAGADAPRESAAKPFPAKTPLPVTQKSGMPFLVSLATFFMVFIIIILVFYRLYRKPVSAIKPEKEQQSPSNDNK